MPTKAFYKNSGHNIIENKGQTVRSTVLPLGSKSVPGLLRVGEGIDVSNGVISISKSGDTRERIVSSSININKASTTINFNTNVDKNNLKYIIFRFKSGSFYSLYTDTNIFNSSYEDYTIIQIFDSVSNSFKNYIMQYKASTSPGIYGAVTLRSFDNSTPTNLSLVDCIAVK